MQKVILAVSLIAILLVLSYFGNSIRSFMLKSKVAVEPIINLNNSQQKLTKDVVDIFYEKMIFSVAWVKVDNSKNLSLYSNLKDAQSSREIFKQKNCKALVNGGFYSKEDMPIGVFISEGEVINKETPNVLFNGVFSMTGDNVASISSTISQDNPRFAVQAGPFLIKNSQLQKLYLKNDEYERRTIVAQTSEGEVVFLSIYNSSSAYLGPKLANLPTILSEVENKIGVKFSQALNLDGGTASTFLTESISLGELTKIGSYFCLKN